MRAEVPRKGFVLIATCIALAILMALAALGIDIGRMYVIKSELQAFADAAALNAAAQSDGTERGLPRAHAAAAELAAGPNAMKWDMGTQPITEIDASVAKDAGQKACIRVTASAPAPLIFLPGFSTVAAAAVACKTPESARLVE